MIEVVPNFIITRFPAGALFETADYIETTGWLWRACGEPPDMYNNPAYASDLKDWTAEHARLMTERNLKRAQLRAAAPASIAVSSELQS